MLRLISIARVRLPDDAGVPIGPHEVDLVWRREQIIVEVDGPGHQQPNSRKKDPARDSDLRKFGFNVVRFPNLQIDRDPSWVVARVERLLTTAQGRNRDYAS